MAIGRVALCCSGAALFALRLGAAQQPHDLEAQEPLDLAEEHRSLEAYSAQGDLWRPLGDLKAIADARSAHILSVPSENSSRTTSSLASAPLGYPEALLRRAVGPNS